MKTRRRMRMRRMERKRKTNPGRERERDRGRENAWTSRLTYVCKYKYRQITDKEW